VVTTFLSLVSFDFEPELNVVAREDELAARLENFFSGSLIFFPGG
jgi:hypothetical protein